MEAVSACGLLGCCGIDAGIGRCPAGTHTVLGVFLCTVAGRGGLSCEHFWRFGMFAGGDTIGPLGFTVSAPEAAAVSIGSMRFGTLVNLAEWDQSFPVFGKRPRNGGWEPPLRPVPYLFGQASGWWDSLHVAPFFFNAGH